MYIYILQIHLEDGDNSCTQQYLNIYSSCEPGQESQLESIARKIHAKFDS